MPIIQIQILEGRSEEQLNKLVTTMTESAVNSLEVKPEQVRVIIHEIPKKHWAVGGITKDKS